MKINVKEEVVMLDDKNVPVFKDLTDIIENQEKLIREFNSQENTEVRITSEFKVQFRNYFDAQKLGEITINETYSRLNTNGQHKYIWFPTTWYYLAYLAAPFFKEIEFYRNYIIRRFSEFEEQNKDFFDTLRKRWNKPKGDCFTQFISDINDCVKAGNIDKDILEVIDFIITVGTKKEPLIEKFLIDGNYWKSGKSLDRGDYFVSPVLSLLELVNQSSSYVADLTRYISLSEIDLADESRYFIFTERQDEDINISTVAAISNRIYYGAPGTGKSYSVTESIAEFYPEIRNGFDNSEFIYRTTLHPEYSYSDFVGQLMPVKKGEHITYDFTPGVFSLALKKALNNPNNYVFLVLEELSRANVAAVFGDLFQLLDRTNGRSDYSITNSLIANYVYRSITDSQEIDFSERKIYLPTNLVIIGTVNTNDQNVFVMDTAFKRRFEWEYVSTDPVYGKNGEEINNPSIEYKKDSSVKWWDFYLSINYYITAIMNLSEDKQIGQFFIKFENDSSRNQSMLQNKLLQYLWEDVQKATYGRDLFASQISSFSELYWKFGDGENVFSDDFLELLNSRNSNKISSEEALDITENEGSEDE